MSLVPVKPQKKSVETYESFGRSKRGGDKMCCGIGLLLPAHLMWLCCRVSDSAAWPVNLFTLQRKLQMVLMQNVLLPKELWILTDLCGSECWGQWVLWWPEVFKMYKTHMHSIFKYIYDNIFKEMHMWNWKLAYYPSISCPFSVNNEKTNSQQNMY